MQKYIAKFEAFDSSSLHDLFKEHNLTIVVLNDMIDKLEKYNLDHVLVNELKKSKERGYRDLRKWKIDSILSRYNSASRLIDMAETIEDYLLELTDNGYRIKVFPSDGYAVLLIYTKGVRKSRLDKVAEVTSFLQHLNNSHRLNVDLESIRDSNEFKVIIKSVVENTKKSAQDEDEDYVAHRTETEHERALRNLRRMINPNTFDEDEYDESDTV
jgi:hypothetical protein